MADEKIIFSMVGVSKTFNNQKKVLNDIYLSFFYGAKIGIIGLNGTGKSAFLRGLAGEQIPDQGAVSRDPNVQVCFLPQNPQMDPAATVLEQVFADFSPEVRTLMEYEAKAMLTRLGITDFAQPVGTLSGGQRKRVALATVLLHPADVLILPMTEDLSEAISLATDLRAAGVSTQIYTEKKKFKAKMNYADKLKVPYVYFLGEDEINAGVVSCKDMRTGEQVKLPRAEAVEKAKDFVESDRQKPVICEK